MVIDSWDGVFLEGEMLIKGELVYLEKSDAPTSLMARGVPMGMLLLTNKRLFFLSRDRQDGIDSAREFLSRFVHMKFTARDIDPMPLAMFPGSDFDPFLKSEYSFVVPLKQIVSCEKFGGRFTLNGKKRFLKIGIAGDSGAITNYCVYFSSPIGSNRVTGPNYVDHSDWFKRISAAVKLNA